jgi:hypothetical protein
MEMHRRNQVSGQARLVEIKIEGQLDESWSNWLEGMEVNIDGSVTTIRGVIKDQVALRGVLSKIWDVNLTLISVKTIEIETSHRRGKGERR